MFLLKYNSLNVNLKLTQPSNYSYLAVVKLDLLVNYILKAGQLPHELALAVQARRCFSECGSEKQLAFVLVGQYAALIYFTTFIYSLRS